MEGTQNMFSIVPHKWSTRVRRKWSQISAILKVLITKPNLGVSGQRIRAACAYAASFCTCNYSVYIHVIVWLCMLVLNNHKTHRTETHIYIHICIHICIYRCDTTLYTTQKYRQWLKLYYKTDKKQRLRHPNKTNARVTKQITNKSN